MDGDRAVRLVPKLVSKTGIALTRESTRSIWSPGKWRVPAQGRTYATWLRTICSRDGRGRVGQVTGLVGGSDGVPARLG